MAYIYSQEGRWDKAVTEYQKLLKLDPNDFNVHNMLGDVFVKKGELQEAFANYLVCSEAYVKLGQAEKASVVYRKIAKLDSTKLDEESQKKQTVFHKQVVAEEAMENNDFDKAIAAFNTVIQLEPDRFDIYQKLGDLYVRKGDSALAVKNYYEIAHIFFTNKRYKNASPLYKKIVELDPSHIEAQAALGEIYAKEGSESEAKKAFLAIAQATLEKKDLDKALEYAQKAADMKSIEAYYYLGQVYFHQNKPEEAQAELEKLLRFKLNHSGALTYMGKIFVGKKEYDEAISTLVRALKGKKEDPEILLTLGEAYEGAGDKKEAGEHFCLACKALETAGRKKEAEEANRRALKNDPQSGGSKEETKPLEDAAEKTETPAPPEIEETPTPKAPEAKPAELPPLPEPPPPSKDLPALTPPLETKKPPVSESGAAPPVEEVSPEEEKKTLLNMADGYVAEGHINEAIEIYQRLLNDYPTDKDIRAALHSAYAMLAQASGVAPSADGMLPAAGEEGSVAAEMAKLAADAKAKSDKEAKQEELKAEEKKKHEADEVRSQKEELEKLKKEAAEQKKILEEEKAALEKMRLEQESARKRAEEEIRKQIEEESKKKAEEQKEAELAAAKEKVEADAKAKGEAEVRQRMEKELKENELRQKQEDELRAKIEAEVRAKLEAETKAKVIEAEKKAEAEAEKRAEIETQKKLEAEKKFEDEMSERKEAAARERMAKAEDRAREILEQESKLRPTMKPAGSLASLAKGLEKKPLRKELSSKKPKEPAELGEDVDEFMTATVAEIYTRQGLYDEAIRIYQKILAREPKNKDIQKKLDAAIAARDKKEGGGGSVVGAKSRPKDKGPAPASKQSTKKEGSAGKIKKSKVSYL